ncbi:MAG: hypothetical protein AB7O73_01065 [Bacteroidia bacterium]
MTTAVYIAPVSSNKSQGIQMPKEIETHFALITLKSDGIVRVVFKADIDFEIEDAKQLFEVLKSFYKEEKLLVLINTGEGVMISREAREFTASDEVSAIVKADAVVVNNLATKLLVRAIETNRHTQRLMKLFGTEKEAIGWLKCLK